jgi:valyl-tRNA synthetase
MLAELADVVDAATDAFDQFHYTRALERTEAFFWSFCDDYLELVKGRAYGGRGDAPAQSAQAALSIALSTLLRLFAPVVPFVTEEVWSWWQEGSVHRAPWPDAALLRAVAGDADRGVLVVAADVLGAVRKAKSDAKRSMRSEVTRVEVTDSGSRLAALRSAQDDVMDAGRVAELVEVEADAFRVDAILS